MKINVFLKSKNTNLLQPLPALNTFTFMYYRVSLLLDFNLYTNKNMQSFYSCPGLKFTESIDV